MSTHIFPTDGILQRKEKEKLLDQKGVAVWMTGLSGSGKTTLAIALEKELAKAGKLTQVLDGDNIRHGLNNNLGFSPDERLENIRRIAEVTKLFVHCGVITICSFVSPTQLIRKTARDIIGEGDFVEVYVSTSLEVCEQRDVKGLYAKARKGEVKDFTGVQAGFEIPQNPALVLDTEKLTLGECVKQLIACLKTTSGNTVA